MNSNKPLLST